MKMDMVLVLIDIKHCYISGRVNCKMQDRDGGAPVLPQVPISSLTKKHEPPTTAIHAFNFIDIILLPATGRSHRKRGPAAFPLA
jgi:hypothetical protein